MNVTKKRDSFIGNDLAKAPCGKAYWKDEGYGGAPSSRQQCVIVQMIGVRLLHSFGVWVHRDLDCRVSPCRNFWRWNLFGKHAIDKLHP
jgi:hypothetical protein